MTIEEIGVVGGASDGGGGGATNASGGNNGSGFPPPPSWPSDTFGCGSGARHSTPPAFLTKTFSIVNDPNTNSIISWSSSGTSFVIWDHLRFTAEIVHLYFKHNNFSSFVTQLHTYGFRKIGVAHKWEYENPNFQPGKEHLLTNIKRRNQIPERVTIRRRRTHPDDHTNKNCSEILRDDINESKLEIQKLKMQQSDMAIHVNAFESELKNIEKISRKLIVIWSKACDRVLGQKIGGNEIEIGKGDDEAIKKRKLDAIEENDERIEESDGKIEEFDGKNGEDEIGPGSMCDDCVRPVQAVREGEGDCGPAGLGGNSGDGWRKVIKVLMEDDEVCDNGGGGEMGNQQAEIAMDLERLIGEVDGSEPLNELQATRHESK